jgi:hypothetical protein
MLRQMLILNKLGTACIALQFWYVLKTLIFTNIRDFRVVCGQCPLLGRGVWLGDDVLTGDPPP